MHTIYQPARIDAATAARATAYAAIFIVLAVLMVRWTAAHDAAVMKAGDAYTDCVKAQYGISPAGYYQEHGAYPTCR